MEEEKSKQPETIEGEEREPKKKRIPRREKPSPYCEKRLKGIGVQLIKIGLIYFVPVAAVYPFFFRRFSFFPDSFALSLAQYFFIIAVFPIIGCFYAYKNRLKEDENKILLWNEMDLKRCRELQAFFESSKKEDAFSCTEQVISSKKEDGDWKITGVKKDPAKALLKQLLGRLTLSESRNYAGLGFGTILGGTAGADEPVRDISQNIERMMILCNEAIEIKVFLPGPYANAQWLSGMQKALLCAVEVPEDCHTHQMLKSVSLDQIPLEDKRISKLNQMIAAQAEAEDKDKLPVSVRGYWLMDNFFIATEISLGSLSKVSLYHTGFFKKFAQKARMLKITPRIMIAK